MHSNTRTLPFLSAIILLLSAACTVSDSGEKTADDTTAIAPIGSAVPAPDVVPAPAMPMDTGSAQGQTTAPVSDMRLEVDLSSRIVRLYRGSDSVAAYRVAVGSTQWPTKTGDWKVTQVVWNPEWTPPDESWAEEREPRKPGDPKNPLGRAQLVYDPPRSIYGTNDPASIGTAVSHGSIRMRNAEIIKLGRQLMESAGVGKDAAWYRNAEQNRTEKMIVDLPGGVPISVRD